VCLDEDTEFIAERLTPSVIDNVRAIEEFTEAWEERSNRLWLSALIGDWPAAATAAEESGDPQLIAITRSRADRFRALRMSRIRSGPAWQLPAVVSGPASPLEMETSSLASGHPDGLGQP
jgi:hypothetical protein